MAMWIFAKAIIAGEPIKLFNNGNMRRDFTYVDDVVEVGRAASRSSAAPQFRLWSSDAPDPGSSSAAWRVYNIGNNKSGRAPRSCAPSRGGDRQKGEA